jgi:hypothetical protein
MTVEVCRRALDREAPPGHGLAYLAESPRDGVPRDLARSSVFHHDVDLTSDRRAGAEIEAQLAADGWLPAPGQPAALIGVRYQRVRRGAATEPSELTACP